MRVSAQGIFFCLLFCEAPSKDASWAPPLAPSPLQGSVEGTPPTGRAVSVSPTVGLPSASRRASSAPWESVALAADGTPPSNRPALQPGATSPPVVPIQGFDFSQGFMSVGASSAELVSATSTSHNHPPAEPYHNSLQSVGTSVGADLVFASSTPARVGQCGCVRVWSNHALKRKRRKLPTGSRTDVTQEVLRCYKEGAGRPYVCRVAGHVICVHVFAQEHVV